MIGYRIATAVGLAFAVTTAAAHSLPKLSDQGSQALQDVDIARSAIFNGHPDVAMQLIKRAQLSLIQANADGTAFNKAEADLKSTPQHPNPSAATNTTSVRWLPIGADLALDTHYSADPAKTAAVATANAQLKTGERDKAIETLLLANIPLSYIVKLVPTKTLVADIDQAASQLASSKYYEADLSLRRAQGRVRYDRIELHAAPPGDVPAMPRHGLKEPVTSSVRDEEETRASK